MYQEAEGGGISTIRFHSRQACCVLTFLCRARLLTTTVVLSHTVCLCYIYSIPFLSGVFPHLCASLLLSSILTFLHDFIFVFLLPFLIHAYPCSHPTFHSIHFQHTLSLPLLLPFHPVVRVMTLLTTQTNGGSGYGLTKGSQSLKSITSWHLSPI